MSQENMSFAVQVLTLLVAAVGAYLGFRNSQLERNLKRVKFQATKLKEDWLFLHKIEEEHCLAQQNPQSLKNKVRKKVKEDVGRKINYEPADVERFDFSG